ncbi:MAG: hypothetical protein AMXMBFR4_13960 [Candidatus Hydrogenedentota bacterium]
MKFYRQLFRLLEVRGKWLFAATIAAAVISTVLDLSRPQTYVAETILGVSELRLGRPASGTPGKGMEELLPRPLPPPVYVDLIQSPTVVGQVLNEMIKQGLYQEDEAPSVDEFAADLSAEVTAIDRTTRPITFAPLIKLTATGRSPELAAAKADLWAKKAEDAAGRVLQLQVSAARELLAQEQDKRRVALDEILQEIQNEQAQWNISVIGNEMAARVELLNLLAKERALVQRDLRDAEDRLAALQPLLEREEPVLKLGKAPSDDAYFIAKGKDGASGIESKIMVTEEPNVVYIDLRKKENDTVALVSGLKAKLEQVDRQLLEVRKEQEELEAQLAEHTRIQGKLDRDQKVAELVFSEVATARALLDTVEMLCTQASADGRMSIGLNRLSMEAHPRKAVRVLGGAVRVLAAAVFAFALGVVFFISIDILRPWAAALMDESGTKLGA